MNYTIDNNKIYLSIDKGEKINASLLKICEDKDISFGWINGIGAIYNPEVGYFDIESKDYIKKTFVGDFELISLIGNMTFKDNQRFIHTHIAFTDKNFHAYGGHLFDCTVSAAGEFIIIIGDNRVDRKYNSEVGLALWNCKIK
tara:strand:+ start:207 stop:635 length:429 start_codon:yes stop_codon:yes gene_type:complete